MTKLTAQQEAEEITRNAWAAYQDGKITLDEFLSVIRLPIKDMILETSNAH